MDVDEREGRRERDGEVVGAGPGRRWQAVGVLGGVLALGIVAVLVSPSGDDASRPATTATTTPASSPTDTDSASPTDATDGDAAGRAPVGYVLDPDVAAAASLVPVGGLSPSTPRADPPGRLRIWATLEATRTSGTWVAVQRADDPAPTAWQDAASIPLAGAGRPALVLAEPDGVVSVSVPTPEGRTLRITAFGIGPTDLTELAGRLRTSAAADEAGILSSQPYGSFGPLRLLLDRPSTGRGLGEDLLTEGVAATAFYRDPAGRIVSVTTSPRDREREGILSPFALRWADTDGSRGRLLTTGEVGLTDHPALGAQRVATFTENGTTVRLASTRDDVDLAALAASATPGDDAMWRAVQARGRGFVDGRGVTYSTAGSGTFADGGAWTLSLADGPLWGSFFVAEGDGTGTFAELYLDQAPCAAITTFGRTTVACARPTVGAGDPATSLRVGQTVPVPFTPTATGWSIAVARSTEDGPLPIVEVAEGREPVTLGRTSGDRTGWNQWASLESSWTEPDPASAQTASWVVDGGLPGATAIGTSTGQAAEPVGELVVLGTPRATRTTGTWLAVATTTMTQESPVGEDAIRVRFDGPGGSSTAGILETATDGVVTLTWTMRDGQTAVIVARGIATDRLLTIAASVRGSRPDGGAGAPLLGLPPTADDGTPLVELARVPVTSATDLVLGTVGASGATLYLDAQGRLDLILGVRTASLAEDVVAALLLPPPDPADPPVDVEAIAPQASAPPLVGTMPGLENWRVVRWRVGDEVVTALSPAPLADVLPALRRGLCPATVEEHAALMAAAAASADAVLAPTLLGDGVTGAGDPWRAELYGAERMISLTAGSTSAGVGLEPSVDRPIRVLRSTDHTFVVALLPEPGAATALEVTIDGEEPVLVPLVPSATGLTTWVGAAYVIDAADEATLHVALV